MQRGRGGMQAPSPHAGFMQQGFSIDPGGALSGPSFAVVSCCK